MVATPFAPGRAVAAVLVALLFAVVIPAPLAQAQAQTQTRDVYVQPGEAQFHQLNFHNGTVPTNFIDNGRGESILRVPVYNTGSTALTNVPVYFYTVPDRGVLGGCTYVNIPAAGSEGPANATATFTSTTRNLPDGVEHNITVEAFVHPKPVGIKESCPPLNGDMSVPSSAGSICLTQTNLSCSVDTDETNNHAAAYVVKAAFLDLQVREIRWCESTQTPTSVCDTDMLFADGTQYNVTPTDSGERRTYFEVVVENVGTWHNMSNYGACRTACERGGFPYTLNVTLLDGAGDPIYLSAATNTSTLSVDDGEWRTHRARSDYFSLQGRAGPYNVTVQLDPAGALRRGGADTTPDIGQRDIEVAYRDFTGSFNATEFKTSAEDAYAHDAGEIISGGLVLRNTGTAGRPSEVPVQYRVYLDNLTSNTQFITEGEYTPTGNKDEENEFIVPISWEFTDNANAPGYLPPGRHTIIAEVDSEYALKEYNETNNNFTLDIFVADTTDPRIPSLPTVTLSQTGAAVTAVRPHERFNVHVDVLDDDAAVTVMGNLTLDSNGSVYRLVKANRTIGNTFHFAQGNFSYDNFSARAADGSENWTLRIVANDSFGNTVTSGPVKIELTPWPIHDADPATIIRMPTWPNATQDYAGTPDPQWELLLTPDLTGYDGRAGRGHQQMRTSNLALNITTLQQTFDVDAWFAESNPENCPPEPEDKAEGVLPTQPTCVGQFAELNNTFTYRFAKDQDGAGPGLWNYSIRIKDVAGEERIINGTLLLRDSAPEIVWSHLNLSSVIPSSENLTTVNITGNFTDDSGQINAVHVNFTRFEPNDSTRINLTVPRADNGLADGIPWYNHTLHLDVGRGKTFGLGGKFSARLEVRDLAGNWNSAALGTFEVKDDEPPRVLTYGIVPATPEVGENVTFYATANDATNVSMRFEVFRTSTVGELLFDAVVVNQSETMNYTFTTNFTSEAVHAWRATPIDGGNRGGEPRLSTLTVRDNLGPKYDVRSPSVVIDGTRYGSGTPRIEVQISDIEGVVPTSIDMQVAGLPVEFDVVPAPGNVTGYLVVHEVRAAKKFNHQDVVEVNVTAQDNSTERLTTWLNFSFVVDDVAPTTRLLSITPQYRDQPGHVQNVSLASRFTLAAEDIDSLPTGVPAEGIRYRILGGGPSAAETVYTGPFRIDDAPGVYTGPRLYQIQFWSEDAVGNFNRNPSITTVYVDDTPPALFQFFPQGRQVNATFVDDRVGVNRSVVWYRLNDQPYVPISLVEQDGAWSVALPEGVKGDRMSYYLQAWDRLDNTETFGNATSPYASFDVSNHEPRIRITAPVDGSRISRSVDLTWEASDEDDDALVYTVYMKAPGKATFAELVRIENTAVKRYTIETARYPDGQYTFRVAAGDGGFVKLAETTVTILNRAEPVGVVSVVGDPLPGETLLVKAEVTKAEADVEARLYLGRTLVNSWSMNDEGRDGDETASDGIYSVRVPVDAAGEYRVEIFTRYREDGVEKESTLSSAATFDAKMTPTYVLAHYGAIIAVIALLAIAGIAVALFVAMRRR